MREAFAAAGSVAKELSLQEIDETAALTAGGFFTIAGTSTVGRVCTISYECNGGHVCGY